MLSLTVGYRSCICSWHIDSAIFRISFFLCLFCCFCLPTQILWLVTVKTVFEHILQTPQSSIKILRCALFFQYFFLGVWKGGQARSLRVWYITDFTMWQDRHTNYWRQFICYTRFQCYEHAHAISFDMTSFKTPFNCETSNFSGCQQNNWHINDNNWRQVAEEDCGLSEFPGLRENSNDFGVVDGSHWLLPEKLGFYVYCLWYWN